MSETRQVQGQLPASNWPRGSLTSQGVKGQSGTTLQVLWCQVLFESCQVRKAFSCCSWADVNICVGPLAGAEQQIRSEAGDFPSNARQFSENTLREWGAGMGMGVKQPCTRR